MMDNDLISRSELLKTMNQYEPVASIHPIEHAMWTMHRQFIEQTPTVDAVVLPVKPGDVVWILNHKFAAEIQEIHVTKDGVFAVWVEFDKGPELTEVWDDGEFDIKEIGRSVYLSLSEWERAMYPCEHYKEDADDGK